MSSRIEVFANQIDVLQVGMAKAMAAYTNQPENWPGFTGDARAAIIYLLGDDKEAEE